MDFPPPPLLRRLEASAADWYPELGSPVTARVAAVSVRPQSALATVQLAGNAGASRSLVVKAPFWSGGGRPAAYADRPRLGLDPGEVRTKHNGEWRALVAAWDAFGTAARPGIGAVRPCLHDPELGILTLERVTDPTLRTLLDRTRDTRRLLAASEHTGAWLREFAHLPALVGLPARRSTTTEVVATASTYRAWFSDRGTRQAVRLADAVEHALSRCSDELEMGCGHGDLAPRNVFVDDRGSVRVIDMLARWRVPLLEDVAYFVLALALGGRHWTRRGADLSDLRTAFLAGARVGDDALLAAFEGLVLLDTWAAATTTATGSAPAWAKRMQRLRRIRFAAGLVQQRLESS